MFIIYVVLIITCKGVITCKMKNKNFITTANPCQNVKKYILELKKTDTHNTTPSITD